MKFWITLAVLLLWSATAEATTYYVAPSPTGNNANPGTIGSRFATLQKCVDVMVAGDTCIVGNGQYFTGTFVHADIFTSGTAGARITYQSETLYGAVINLPTLVSVNYGFALHSGVHDVVIDGFTFTGGSVSGSCTPPNPCPASAGVQINGGGATNIFIQNNKFDAIGRVCSNSPFGNAGIHSDSGAAAYFIKNNIFSKIGRLRNGESGCTLTPTNDQHDHGMYLSGAGGAVIQNNICYLIQGGLCITLFGGTINGMNIYNNTFHAAEPDASPVATVGLDQAVSNVDVANNIFYLAGSAQIQGIRFAGFTHTNVTIRTNISDGSIVGTHTATGVTVTGSINSSASINFTNVSISILASSPGSRDYHLLTTSSAKDAGLTLAGVTTDFDGGTRVAPYDIGADEFGGGPGVPAPVTRYLDTVACTGNYSVASRNCTGTGSGLNSYTTYAAIFAVTTAGDTIDVRGGTWPGIDTNSVNFPSGTSSTALVTFQAHAGETVTLPSINFATAGDSYILIDGVHIDGGTVGVSINQGTHHVTIQNSEVKNTAQSGIIIQWGNNNGLESPSNSVLNNWIHHIGTCNGPTCAGTPTAPGAGQAHGLYVSTGGNIVRGNTFDHIGQYAIYNFDIGHAPTNNVYDRNLITLAGQNITQFGDSTGCCGAIYICCGSAHQVTNNITYGQNLGQGLLPINAIYMEACTNCVIYNNTAYNVRGFGIYIASGVGVIAKNNLSYLAGQTPVFGPATQSNNIFGVNPLFVNAGAFDFHLQAASPVINAGTTVPVIRDFFNAVRPQGCCLDVGATEYVIGADAVAPGPPANYQVN